MPRTNIDYSNTSIYKLCCKDINITEVYVGHTTCMRRRKCQHKSTCYNETSRNYNFNVYQFIRDNGGFDNWDMIEIERYNAVDGYDATKRERYWIEELKATLNMVIPTRTQKEYRENNKEKLNEKHKKYYENNKEIFKEYKKEYYENNKEYVKEKAKEYRENNKDKIKEIDKKYYENNKDKILENHKEYRENNKEIIAEKKKEKIECECGCKINRGDLAKHKRTKKHNVLIQLVCNKTSNVSYRC